MILPSDKLKESQKLFGVSFTGMHAGSFTNDGYQENNIYIYYLLPVSTSLDSGIVSGFGMALKKRFYQDRYKGRFWGYGLSASSLTWEDDKMKYNNNQNIQTSSGYGIRPFVEIGFRYGSDLTIAPVVGIGYRFTTLETYYNQKPKSGLSFHAGLGLAFRFIKKKSKLEKVINPYEFNQINNTDKKITLNDSSLNEESNNQINNTDKKITLNDSSLNEESNNQINNTDKKITLNNSSIIGKWNDDQEYLERDIIIYKTNEGVLVKTISKNSDLIIEKKGSIMNDAKGKRVNYENEHSDYFLIYDNSKLAYCDQLGCFKELESEFINRDLLKSPSDYKIVKIKDEINSQLSSNCRVHLKQLIDLYYDLIIFKEKSSFIAYGFDPFYEYNYWILAIKDLKNNNSEDRELVGYYSFVSGDLEMLGMEYVSTNGKESEYTLYMKKIIKNAIDSEFPKD